MIAWGPVTIRHMAMSRTRRPAQCQMHIEIPRHRPEMMTVTDSQAVRLEERFPSGMPDGRDARLALLATRMWRDENERAVDRVKKPVSRSEPDRWFRKAVVQDGGGT
jgi:hypothetical protein